MTVLAGLDAGILEAQQSILAQNQQQPIHAGTFSLTHLTAAGALLLSAMLCFVFMHRPGLQREQV